MENSLKIIQQLVADFKTNEKAFLAQIYQESQVRQDFIDKFFTALGWDVTHTQQKNPYEQEVKIENKVNTQGSQRRADYAFFVLPNYRDVKFFAEAKKPAHDLSNADYYHQTIRYGWNAGTPIAILTDFEEFHVLDCRYKPDIGDALNRKLKYFHYSEYADEEKFKEIFYLFGREAVANGSLEKYAADLPKPRGKKDFRSFKNFGSLKTVDEDFLETLDEYRNTLAKAFKKENQELDGEELTEAVQRTLDRLVFIRFLEDKGIEEPEIIGLYERQSPWIAFISLCKRLEPKYNGLIFKPHRILDGKEFNPPDDKAFAKICAELADPSSPYDFDKIPISILGSIYERFLGKVVHATAKRVEVQEKPEVRKAGGVYYTPEYIVRYIVKETVGRLLFNDVKIQQTSFPNASIGNPSVDSRQEHAGMTNIQNGKTPDEIAAMSFADIACGSGSFLIEVYSQLLDYHDRWYNAHRDKAKKDDVFERDGHLHLSLKKKKEILTNNIYGVDIDFQATEVTQLSLYLKLLENVTNSETHQLGLFKETILPDLRNNIVCGNSLIGTDIGGLFESESTDKLKPMNFEDVFPTIMKQGGFDAIVGNPPYSTITEENSKSYFSDKFHSAEGRYDTFELFIEKAVNQCRKGGKVGYIVPSPLITNLYSRKLRKFILENSTIEEIVNFGMDVFQDPTVHTCIIVLNTSKLKNNFVKIKKQVNFVNDLNNSFDYKLSQDQFLTNANFVFDIFFEPSLDGLKQKLNSNTDKLGVRCFIRQCIKTGNDDLFVKKSDKLLNTPWKQSLRGKSIERYKTNEKDIFLKYGDWLARNWANKTFYETPKIAVRETGNRITATIDRENRYFLSSLYSIYPKTNSDKHSLEYYLAIINSTLATYYIKKVAFELTKGAFTKVRTNQLSQLPTRTINFNDSKDKSRHDLIVTLVEQMLEAKQKLSAAKTDGEVNRLELLCASVDRKIDEAVYELYGLTEEEVKIVEGEE